MYSWNTARMSVPYNFSVSICVLDYPEAVKVTGGRKGLSIKKLN